MAAYLANDTRMANGDLVPEHLRPVLYDCIQRRLDIGDETDALQ